jgi:hypothetical protein
MNRNKWAFLAMALILATLSATAELQTVRIGGDLRIRGNFISNWAANPPVARHYGLCVLNRPLGGPYPHAVVSPYKWDREGPDYSAIEQRTRLNVTAEFTNEVSTFIE